jgi:type IV secretion system protein VirD4
MLDEFANIGKIPHFEQLIATIRSREISATLVVQTKSQLKALYKDHSETITGNCDTEIFLGGKEPSALKDLAAALGKETIDDMNSSDSRGASSSKTNAYSKLGRDLMGLPELSTMSRKKCIVMLNGEPPFLSDKYDIKKHPNYKDIADNKSSPNWFDTRKHLLSRRSCSMSAFKDRHARISASPSKTEKKGARE